MKKLFSGHRLRALAQRALMILFILAALFATNLFYPQAVPTTIAYAAGNSSTEATRRLVVQITRPPMLSFLSSITSSSVRSTLSAQLDGEVKQSIYSLPGQSGNSQYLVYELPQSLSGAALEQAMQATGKVWGVVSVEADLNFTAAFVPNDPYYLPYQDSLWGPYGVNAPAVWEITQGSASVTVAILDTGITDHPDLDARRLNNGFDFVSDIPSARDGNGWDADAHDPGDYNGNPSSWHGTHVTGTINAVGNNGFGVAGISWNSGFVPVRVLGAGGGSASDLASAIVCALPPNPWLVSLVLKVRPPSVDRKRPVLLRT